VLYVDIFESAIATVDLVLVICREVQAARQLGGSSAMDTHASGQTTSQGESSRAGHSQATMPSSIREPHREAPHPAHINQHRPLLIDFSNVSHYTLYLGRNVA